MTESFMDNNVLITITLIIAIIAGFATVLLITWRQKKEMQKNISNLTRLAEEQGTMLKKLNQTENPEVQQLQQDTQLLRDNITDTAQMTDEELQVWIDRQICERQFFLQPDLNLKKLAGLLGLKQNRLMNLKKSQIDNFSDYINDKRLAYACEMLRNQSFLNIEAISDKAGFSSRVTFQRYFKKKMGITPSQYRDNIAASS